MKIMMSAGEASGDLHGGALAAELKKLRPDIELFGMGGSDMQKSGVRIIYDINNLGIIGVVEVVKHIPFFFRLRDTLKQAMIDEKPDALVCIDYPGFNMRLAHVAKELGIPVIYYIAPTIWAWNKGRAKKIVRDVAAVASIFPFEAKAYKEAGANVTFVGHPLADTVKPTMPREKALEYFRADPDKKHILLMPEAAATRSGDFSPRCLMRQGKSIRRRRASSSFPAQARFP